MRQLRRAQAQPCSLSSGRIAAETASAQRAAALAFNSSRVLRTISRYCFARSSNTSYLPALMVSGSINSPPTATAHAPAFRKSAAVSRFTPPVGIISICGKGPFSALMYFAPPTAPARENLHGIRAGLPCCHHFGRRERAGQDGLRIPLAALNRRQVQAGVTKNCAPASMQARAVSGSSTGPAPRMILSPNWSAIFSSALNSARHRHRDLGREDSAAVNRFNRLDRGFRGSRADDGHDADLDDRGKNCCFSSHSDFRFLPIHDAAIVGIVGFLVSPVVADLVGHRVLVEFDAESRTGGQLEIAVADL